MSDPNFSELAHNTVEFLKPYLTAAGGVLAKDSLDAVREKLFGWLKSKFTKPVQSATLEAAVQAPQDAATLETLQLMIRQALEQQEEFRKELIKLLPKEILPPGIVQTLNQSGDNNIGVQNTGNKNTINIQK